MAGDDFDGVFRLGAHADPVALPPYVEVIRLDRIRRDDPDLVARVVALTGEHLARRPGDNPDHPTGPAPGRRPAVARRRRISTRSTSTPSGYAASAAPPPSWPPISSAWLNLTDRPGTESAGAAFPELAAGAKSLQFALARVVRGRQVDLTGILEPMEEHWARAMAALADRYGT